MTKSRSFAQFTLSEANGLRMTGFAPDDSKRPKLAVLTSDRWM